MWGSYLQMQNYGSHSKNIMHQYYISSFECNWFYIVNIYSKTPQVGTLVPKGFFYEYPF
jgi:hypothetical protein